ncbi:hypothetical protein J5681_07305 [bacterium]|nr:hypothetical protein [bacterium]
MKSFLKSVCFSKLLILLAFVAVAAPFSIFADNAANPTVDVTFKKSGKSVVYMITYGKNTKFNDNEAAPFKFLFLDAQKNELGKIERAFFAKNKEGKAEYTSDFGETSVKIVLPVCLYNEKTGLAEKCTVKNLKLEIK